MQRIESGFGTQNQGGPDQGIPYDMISLESLGTFMLFGPIDGNTAFASCDFVVKANLLQQNMDPLTFLVNSPGGDVNDGFAIIDNHGDVTSSNPHDRHRHHCLYGIADSVCW